MKQLPREYKVGETNYIYDKKNLKRLYTKYINCSDQEFVDNAVDILHFACYVSWLKEIDTDTLLADDGLIHELVHLLKQGTRNCVNIETLREKFDNLLVV